MKNLFFLLLVLSFQSAIAVDLYYLKPDSINLKVIPVPPAVDSEMDIEDLNMVRKLQKDRTESECKRAIVENEGFATSFFGETYGPLTNQEAKQLVEFQERLFNEVNFYSRILKQKYARLRPYERDSEIRPCLPLQKPNSFPSGHSAIAYVAAKTFSMIYPDKSELLLQRAKMISYDRVLGGVHHPSDTTAGRILGEKVFEALMKEEKFQNDVKALTP